MKNRNKNAIDITGCQVSLYSMNENSSSQMLQSIQQTNTEAVWSQIDRFGTQYRGDPKNVIDAASGLFINSYEPNSQMSGQFTFSKGCPRDNASDNFIANKVSQPNQASNLKNGDFLVHCKYAFYTFGKDKYVDEITHIVSLATTMGLEPQSGHFATLLTGTANQLFAYFEATLAYAHEHLTHYVLEATVSVNAPSLEGVANA